MRNKMTAVTIQIKVEMSEENKVIRTRMKNTRTSYDEHVSKID
jgi:hypothetical protein